MLLVIHGEKVEITDVDFEVRLPAPARFIFMDFEIQKDNLVSIDLSQKIRQRKSIIPILYFELDPEAPPVIKKFSLIPVDAVIENVNENLTTLGIYRLPTGSLVALIERTPK